MSTLQHDLFSPTCCNPCLLKPSTVKQTKLSKCLGCKLILYCSPAHQKLDWRIHRKFCQAASAIMERHNCPHLFAVNGPIKNQEDLNVTTLKVKFMLKSLLKRPLNYHEEELTSFPVMCAVCYSTMLSKLYQCNECKAVSYCSEEHEHQYASTHRGECTQLKIYYCKFKIKSDIIPKLKFQEKCDLFESNLATAMKTMFDIGFDSNPTGKLAEYQKFSFISDFSCIATVTYIVRHLDMQQYRGQQFTIYVAGATVDEVWFTPAHVEFFFVFFPKLLKLNVIFVGPEVAEVGSKTTALSDGRLLFKSSYKAKLEDHLLEQKDCLKPNLIVCFNCGFSENTQKREQDGDHWYKAVRCMLDLIDLPLVFTSYTNLEADFDFAALMKIIDERRECNNVRMERIIPKQQNPFRDMRALRSWQFNDPERIFYRNGYVQAVRVKRND